MITRSKKKTSCQILCYVLFSINYTVSCTESSLYRHSSQVCFQPIYKPDPTEGYTWTEARKTCEDQNQRMAMVTYEEYQLDIKNVLNNESSLWIGAKEGYNWVWDSTPSE